MAVYAVSHARYRYTITIAAQQKRKFVQGGARKASEGVSVELKIGSLRPC